MFRPPCRRQGVFVAGLPYQILTVASLHIPATRSGAPSPFTSATQIRLASDAHGSVCPALNLPPPWLIQYVNVRASFLPLARTSSLPSPLMSASVGEMQSSVASRTGPVTKPPFPSPTRI